MESEETTSKPRIVNNRRPEGSSWKNRSVDICFGGWKERNGKRERPKEDEEKRKKNYKANPVR